MAYDGRYDDPKFIDAFLADMKVTAEEMTNDNKQAEDVVRPQANDHTIDLSYQYNSQNGTYSSAHTHAACTPPVGIRAPPPTPEAAATAKSTTIHLSPIDERSNATQPQNTVCEQAQSFSPLNASAPSFDPSCVNSDLVAAVKAQQLATENNLASTIWGDEEVRNYHQDALEKFREQAHARVASRASVDREMLLELLATKAKDLEITDDSSGTPMASDQKDLTEVVNGEHSSHAPSSVSTGAVRESQDNTIAASGDESDDDSSIDIIVDAPQSPDSSKSAKSIIAITAPGSDVADRNGHSKVIKEATNSVKEEHEDGIKVNKDSRDDAIFFSDWGVPIARSASPARVRKVVIYQLPANTDFTLIQSLIHGGAIESMTMTPPHNGTVNAFVTFTDADACDSYYQKYPNGLEFKHLGKKCTVFVHIGVDVDVVSGVLQSYLDCGASRVIRVTGADHDWSMKALHKVAGGKDNRRKVEAIHDNCRNDSRTIVFRFTKIADAVSLRGELLRDTDWQDTDIQFMADPCEKATGVHFE